MTDANVLLGYLNPDRPRRRRRAARRRGAPRRCSRQRVAEPLGLALLEAAHGAHQIADASMMRAVKRGLDRSRARPARASRCSRSAATARSTRPAWPARSRSRGSSCRRRPACSARSACSGRRVAHHAVRTLLRAERRARRGDAGTPRSAPRGARRGRSSAAAASSARAVGRRALGGLRYAGQSFELTVPVPPARSAATSLAASRKRSAASTSAPTATAPSTEPVESSISGSCMGRRARPPMPAPGNRTARRSAHQDDAGLLRVARSASARRRSSDAST